MTKKPVQIILFFFFGLQLIYGQGEIGINDFLGSARNQHEIQLGERISEYLSNTNYKLPLVERLEFRTESHDWDIAKQEWALRLIPNAINHRKYQKQFHASTLLRNELSREVALNDALLERYHLLNDYINLFWLMDGNYQLKNLYGEKLEILKNSIDQPGFDIIDLVNAEERLFEQEWELLDLQGLLKELKGSINGMANGKDSILFDPLKLIGPEQIEAMINASRLQQSFPSLLLTRQRARIDQIQHEYNLEKAKANRILGFVQAKYWGWDNDLFNEALSLGLELRIPLKGEARIELNDLELERIEEENDYLVMNAQINTLQQEIENRLDQLLQQYHMAVRQNKDGYARKLLEQENIAEIVTPINLIKMQEMLLKRQLLIERLSYAIRDTYIEWLNLTGKISEQPLKNHLYLIPEPF
jgi:hypothetical protein